MRGDCSVGFVTGLGVERYARRMVAPLRARGVEVRLLPGPGGPTLGNHPRATTIAGTANLLAENHLHDLDRAVTLVGHSVGCQVALRLAALRPELVARLLLVAPTVDPAQRRPSRLLAAWLSDSLREPLSLVRDVAPDWLRVGPRRLAAVVRSALADRPEEVAREVQAAVTVVRGENDPLCGQGWASELAERCRGRVVVVPGGPHVWPYASPGLFADLVTR